ncbi:FAD-dependent oxidoreductase, partial [bacterium]|nr:FAD-dependent oxidoreductase [bacterium]
MQSSTAATPYPHIFTPLRVGRTELRNRLIMGAMHTRLENEKDSGAKLAAFFGARANGGVALIVTGGYAPNRAGLIEVGGPILDANSDIETEHRPIVDAVHAGGAKILLQILHTGRYGKHPDLVGASAMPSRINPLKPRPLSTEEVERTIDDFASCAELARNAGYDGVEVMGSEGYLLNQFLAVRTNNRTDKWGGSLENRMRFPAEIVRRIRARVGDDFIIMYRISALDLVEDGATAAEIDEIAHAIEGAGADILNTGIGWHESLIPTIAYPVPRAAFRDAWIRLKNVVSIPVVASNRINTPELAEDIVAKGEAQLISMARPFLADPEFAVKSKEGRREDLNVCIACNQACLDYAFSERVSTCLVNPIAGRELEFVERPIEREKNIAVVGSGPAGLAFAINAARRGHKVSMYESSDEVGGQLNLASRIPGKQEFFELLRYFKRQLQVQNVAVITGQRVGADQLTRKGFDHIVIASGIVPSIPDIPGINHPSVLSYIDVITRRAKVGKRVAIIGTGGIGHDVAELLTAPYDRGETTEEFLRTWGVDPMSTVAGGLVPPEDEVMSREVTMFQRGKDRVGSRLGKSTGWIHRAKLRRRNVEAIAGCEYIRIDDAGLHYCSSGVEKIYPADNIIM